LVAFDADPIAAARDGSRGGVDDIADRDDDQLQEAAASGAVGRVLRFAEGPIINEVKGGLIVARSTLRDYRRASLENQRKFDSWLEANAVLGFILFLGIMAMALAGLNSAGSPDGVTVPLSVTALK
jgi:hypothetical protein